MLDIFANYAVPACLFVLMFLSGTEIAVSDFRGSSLSARAVFLGVAGPLVALPLIALLINVLVSPPLPVGTGLLLLSLCPNGGISNYYCYLARCNVLLSATITAIGTLLSLLTISLWLQLLQDLPVAATGIAAVPSATILGQLIFFVILPMTIGISIRHVCPKQIAEAERWLKTFSIAIVALVLTSTAATVSEELSSLMLDIIASATLFIAAAMTLGWALGSGLGLRDRPVLAIEASVRNVAVALIIGRALLSMEDFGLFASFLTGYFVVEIAIMLPYARLWAGKIVAGQELSEGR